MPVFVGGPGDDVRTVNFADFVQYATRYEDGAGGNNTLHLDMTNVPGFGFVNFQFGEGPSDFGLNTPFFADLGLSSHLVWFQNFQTVTADVRGFDGVFFSNFPVARPPSGPLPAVTNFIFNSHNSATDNILVGPSSATVDTYLDGDTLTVDYSGASTGIATTRFFPGSVDGWQGRYFDGSGHYVDFDDVNAFVIKTGNGNNVIQTGDFGDQVTTGTGDDSVNTGGSNDTITVNGGNDSIDGGSGGDWLIIDYSGATSGITTQNLAPGSVDGFRGTYTDGAGRSVTFDNIDFVSVRTGAGNDNITLPDPGLNSNSVTVNGGTDTVVGSSGRDTLNVNYSASTSGIVSVLTPGTLNGWKGSYTDNAGRTVNFDNINNVNITTGSGDDAILGTSFFDTFTVSAGTDFVDGRGGSDSLYVNYAAATNGLTNTPFATGSLGSGFQGTITDGANHTVHFDNIGNLGRLDTGMGDDVLDLSGLAQNGTISVIGGHDTITAKFASLIVDYSAATTDVTGGATGGSFGLVSGSFSDGGSRSLTFAASGMTVTTGSGNDNLDLSLMASSVAIHGGGGNDILTTRSGTLYGDDGNDTLTGLGSQTFLFGGSGDDLLIRDGSGSEILGGPGNDTVSYGIASHGVDIDLQANSFGVLFSDYIFDVENASGSPFGDTIWGDGGPNVLNGDGGKDFLQGNGGADRFVLDATALATAQSATPAFVFIEDYDRSGGAYNFAEGDQIDLSAVLSAAYNHGSGEPVGSLVRIVPGAYLQVDPDGTANGENWVTLAKLVQAQAGDTVNVILDATQPAGVNVTVGAGISSAGPFPPAIDSNGGGDTATVSIPENTTAVTTVHATDPDPGTTLTYSIGPGGTDGALFKIDSNTGALSFISPPDFELPKDFRDYNNTYVVRVIASDGLLFDDQTITVNVTDVADTNPNAPVITSNGGANRVALSLPENTAVVTAVTATSPNPGQQFGYSIIGGEDQSRFNINSVSGVLSFNQSFIPEFEHPFDSNGDNVYTVQVRAQDVNPSDGLSDTQTIEITITDANKPPQIVSGGGAVTFTESIPENTIALPRLKANDFDAGATISWSIVGGPDQALFQIDPPTPGLAYIGEAQLSFVAPPDFENPTDSDHNNSYVVQVRASDGQMTSPIQTIVVNVTDVNEMSGGPNQAPVAQDGSAQGNEDTAIGGTAVAIDPDNGPAALSYALIGSNGGAQHGSVTMTSGGAFTYTPGANFNGTDAFQFQANDGNANSNLATISITVNPVDDAPVAQAGATSGTQDAPISGHAVATDVDNAANQLNYSLVGANGGAVHGTVSLNADGSFVYTPAPGFSGSDAFNFKANDGQLDSNTAAITIDVHSVNHAPVAQDGGASGNEDTAIGGTAVASDADGDSLTYALVGANGGAAHGTVSLNANGSFTYTPAPDFNGSDSFNFKANDGALDSNTASVAITVNPVDDPPVITSNGGGDTATISVLENTTAVTTVTASDIDGPALTFALSGGADQGKFTINPTTGVLAFATAPDFKDPTDSDHNNSYVVQVRASDGTLTDDQTITVNVLNRPDSFDAGFYGDVNGDGRADVFLRENNGPIALWLLDGTTALFAQQIGGVGLEWHVEGYGDFNGDHRAELLWENTAGTVMTWQLNRAQVTSQQFAGPGPQWHVAGIGDFNGDGRDDIFWRDTGGNLLQWQMDGGIKSAAIFGAVGNEWHVEGVGDFGGDGKADILWRSEDGSLLMFQMDGTQRHQDFFGQVGLEWHIRGLGDFDGDHKQDILWQNDNGLMMLWRMDGAHILSQQTFNGLPIDWHVFGTGDFGGDGKADILWRNEDGTVAIWEMDGAHVAHPQTITPLDNTWALGVHQFDYL